MIKNLLAMQEMKFPFLVQVDALEKETATHSSIQLTPVFLPGESQSTEEPGELQSMGLQRVRHNLTTEHTHTSVVYIRVFSIMNPQVTHTHTHTHTHTPQTPPACTVDALSPSAGTHRCPLPTHTCACARACGRAHTHTHTHTPEP